MIYDLWCVIMAWIHQWYMTCGVWLWHEYINIYILIVVLLLNLFNINVRENRRYNQLRALDTQDTGRRQTNTRHRTKTNTITQHRKLKRWTTEYTCKRRINVRTSIKVYILFYACNFCSNSEQSIILSFFISSHFLHFIQRKTNVDI